MNKYVMVLLIIVVVFIAEMAILVVQPVVVDMANTANATMAASSNMSNYPGTANYMVSTPWQLFFVPPAIGMWLVFKALKAGR